MWGLGVQSCGVLSSYHHDVQPAPVGSFLIQAIQGGLGLTRRKRGGRGVVA